MTEPLVTIIIPCYNAVAYVGDSVECALSQTWPNIEVIVVDDGSTDGSAETVLQTFGNRVKLIRQQNHGASAARNRALQEVRGDYIQYLDADDLLHLEKITTQMRVAAANPQAVTWCHFQPFRAQPGDMPFRVESAQLDMSSPEYLRLYFEERCNIPHTCHLIPRAVAERAGPWDETLTLNDDGEYAARVVAASSGLIHAGNGPLYFYRKQVGSLSAIKSESRLYSAMVALDKIAALAETHDVALNQTRLAWKYYVLMTTGYPLSVPYLPELEWRIRHYGGENFKPKLGGPAINRLAEAIGWKTARRLQIAAHRFKANLS